MILAQTTLVERKAFRIAQIALRHDDDALDAAQEALLPARPRARRERKLRRP